MPLKPLPTRPPKKHTEQSGRLKSPPTVKDIAAHLACCHVTTLLLFLQPTAARVGKEREPDRSEACWLDWLADWVALLPKPHLQAKYFHLLPLVLVLEKRMFRNQTKRTVV